MGTVKWADIDIEPETSAWLQAHRALSQLAKERAHADAEEGRWLLAALRSAAHLHLGFASFSEYIERSFGYKPRTTQEKLRVAEALEELPVLSQALEQGTVHWSAVRELTRVAVPDNQHAWLAVVEGKTLRQLEELVAGKLPGDVPTSLPRPSERRHILRFEVAPETFALVREALTTLRRNTDTTLDDDAALLALARLALGGPRDEGRASYQIALTLCPNCGQGHQPSNRDLVPIGPEILEMAHCDAQHLGCVSPRPANDSTPEPTPNPTNDAHVSANARAEQDPAHAPTTSSLRASERVVSAHAHAHVGAKVSLAPNADSALARAKQTTPPALRRAVLARDHRCCRVPGCRNTAFVDVHHLHLRSEGGPHRSENLLTLCGLCRARHIVDSSLSMVRQRAYGSDMRMVALTGKL
jgi:hypothetical protein